MKQETLPERLKRLVEERGTNPRALSLAAGLNQTAVRDIVEGNSKRPLHTTIDALAKQLGVHPDYLACRTNDPRGSAVPASEIELNNALALSQVDAVVPLKRLGVVVKALAEYREEEGLAFTSDEEAEMIVSFCRWYGGEVAAGKQAEALGVDQAKSLLRLLDSRRLR